MRFFVRLPGPFGVSGRVPTLADLDDLQEAKVAEYYHQYCAYYNSYVDAHDRGDHKEAAKMYRKCVKYSKKLGPYVSHGDAQWSFE